MKTAFTYLTLMGLLVACSTREEKVEETWPDGNPKRVAVYTGKGADRKKAGEIGYYQDGKPMIEGNLDTMNKRDGLWKYWYKNGQLWSECEYRNGLKHGKSIVYYDNGQKRYEGQYADDKQAGQWKFWDVNGKLITELSYDTAQ